MAKDSFGKEFRTKTRRRTEDGIVEAVNVDGTYVVRVPGRAKPYPWCPCIIPKVTLSVGQGCTLGFLYDNPDMAVIVAVKNVGRHTISLPGQLVLGEWMQCDASPLCNRRAPGLMRPFPWGIDEVTLESTRLFELDRHFPPDGIISSAMSGFYSSEGVVLRPDCVTAMTTFYDPGDSLVLGQLVKQLNLESNVTKEWRIRLATPFAATDSGSTIRQGQLCWNPLNDLYTVATRDGLVHIDPKNETPRLTRWKKNYGLPPEQNFSVVSHSPDYTFALQGGWNAVNTGPNGPYGGARDYYDPPANSMIHGYIATDLSKGFSAYRHAWSKRTVDLLPGYEIIQGCNGGSGGRWPYLAGLSSWLVWVFAKTGVEFVSGLPTDTRAKLLAINAATGAVRVLDEFSAPVDLIPYRDDLLATAEPDAIYNSTPHPDDWVALGGGLFDKGHHVPPGMTLLPYPPDSYGPSYYSNVVNYQGPTLETDVVAGHDSPLLACGNGGNYPRGIVAQQTTESSYYVVIRQPATVSANAAREKPIPHGLPHWPPPFNDYEFRYEGNFTDFAAGSTVTFGAYDVRVYHMELKAYLQVDYRINPDKRYKPQLRHYNGKGQLLGTKDLGRLFEVDGTRYLREPQIYDLAVSGPYLWILMSDWSDKDTEVLRILCLDRETRAEISTFELGGDDRTLNSRPQLMAGEDAQSAWARAFARWQYESETKWLTHTVRQAAEESSTGAFASTDPDEAPVEMTETANLAVREDRLYWLQYGKNLRQTKPTP